MQDGPFRKALRVARGTILRMSSEVFFRIKCYFDGTPYDFAAMQLASDHEADRIIGAFMNKNRCCLRPLFCRRVRRMVDEFGLDLKTDPQFRKMANFWADEGEATTSVRNERQHTKFNQAMMSRKRSAARPKVIRILTQSFCQTIRDDHRTQFAKRKHKQFNAHKALQTALRETKKVLQQKKRRGKSTPSALPLGAGRTPQLQFINAQVAEAKAKYVEEHGTSAKIPKQAYFAMRVAWCDQGENMLQELRLPYETVVHNARESRHFRYHQGERPEARAQQMPEAPAQEALPNSLWGMGNKDFPVAPAKLKEHAASIGSTSITKLVEKIERPIDVANLANIGSYYCPDRGVNDTGDQAVEDFDYGALRAWRKASASCFRLHPGLGRSTDAAIYYEAIRMQSQLDVFSTVLPRRMSALVYCASLLSATRLPRNSLASSASTSGIRSGRSSHGRNPGQSRRQRAGSRFTSRSTCAWTSCTTCTPMPC